FFFIFFFSSRRRHTRSKRDWSSDVCSSDLLYTYQANAELVFRHFANGTDTTVAEVVDIIDFAFTVTDIDELFHNINDVVFAQDRSEERRVGKECRVRWYRAI